MKLSRSRIARRVPLLAVLALVLGCLAATAAQAATIQVTRTDDPPAGDTHDCGTSSTNCSLRQAINDAGTGDTIHLPAGTYTLDRSQGNLTVDNCVGGVSAKIGGLSGLQNFGGGTPLPGPTACLTINGDSARSTIIDAQGNSRVFENFGELALTNLTVTGGNGTAGGSAHPAGADDGVGGGILNDGLLEIDHVRVTGNSAADIGGGIGSPFLENESGTLTVASASEISHNTSSAGGGVFEFLFFTQNSTISNNKAVDNSSDIGAVGGGVAFALGLVAENTTVADNTATTTGGGNSEGAGVWGPFLDSGLLAKRFPSAVPGLSSQAVAHPLLIGGALQASIVAHNTTEGGLQNCQLFGDGLSGGYNVSDDTSCDFTDATDAQSVDAKLFSLMNNGGQTDTQLISRTSPAFDREPAGTESSCPTTDQRDVSRPQFTACDSGAAEIQAADVGLTKTVTPGTVTVGQNVTYTLTSTNNGPETASNTVVTDTLPAGTAFVAASPSQGSCTSGQSVTCSLGAVSSGATATITIVARVVSVGTFVNSANVTADPSDPNTANNAASASVTGLAPAAPKVTAGPTLRIAGAHAGCAAARTRIRVRLTAAGGVRSVKVTLGKKVIKRTKSTSFTLSIPRSKLRVGHNVLKIVVTDAQGRHATRRAPLTRCRVRVAPHFTG